ncbi:MAG TPA: BTAD domain-containing putative transcriptional regulator [Acidiferrobacterales bacterium]|nr:BTAD domain-containing putative transcriptional regulator [Acidiferrobacterales bacterium]
MTKNIVPAKITSPKPLHALARARMFRALDGARKRPAVWITAPPGAGKTTLVSTYLDQSKHKRLWYQVDEGDVDVATLFHYLGLAVKKAMPRTRKPLPKLAPEYLPNLNAFFRLFFRALFSRLEMPYILVFDNYQEVAADAAFHQAIGEAVSQMPAGSNIFILSRNDPPAAFAQLQVSGLMARIDWEILKLTAEESKRLIALKKGAGWPLPLQERLYALCEGWIAGLLLLLETSMGKDIADLPRQKFAPQVLFDYFGSQVFDRMELCAREILVQSAFLPKMTTQAVEQLTENANAGRVLLDLHRRNYFISKHGDDPPVYQYHPLFRNFLLNRAPAMFDPACLQTIKQHAAALLAESGQLEDAVGLWREVNEENGIIGLIVQHAANLLQQGRTKTLESWAGCLPEEAVQRTPWVLYWLGLSAMASDAGKSLRYLERAFALFDTEPNPTGAYLSWSAIVRCVMHRWGDYHPLDRWIGLFDELQARHGNFPSIGIETQVAGSMFGALVFRQPNHLKIGFWKQRLQALLLNVTDPGLEVMLGAYLLHYYIWFGFFPKAKLLIDTLRRDVLKPSTQPIVLLHWTGMEASYYWSTGNYDSCLRMVAETLQLAETHGVQMLANTLTLKAYAYVVKNDLSTASAILKEARQYLLAPHLLERGHYHFLVSMTALFQQDLARAREHAELALRLTQETGAVFPQMVTHFGAAQVAFAEGDYEQSTGHVAQARALMPSVTADYSYLLSEARLAFMRGDDTAGLRFLRDALALGKRHDILHYPWWSSAAMAYFYIKALDAGIEVVYVQAAIRKRDLVPDAPFLQAEAWPFPVKLYTLGRFTILIDGKPLRFTGKAQRKPLELLMALIAFGGREVSEQQLTEALWPDADGDAAHEACAIALHRLRKLLGHDQAINLQNNQLSLDSRYVWLDTWAFEHWLAQINKLDSSARRHASEKAMALYQGPFLGNQNEAPWALPPRERLRTKFLRHLVQGGRSLLQAGECEQAILVFEKGLEVDELAEECYRHLMRCYQRLDRRAEAISVYQRCRKTLAAVLGISPAPETEALYQTLRQK